MAAVFDDQELVAPKSSPLWGAGVFDEANADCTGFLCMPRRPYHWYVNTHGVHTPTKQQVVLSDVTLRHWCSNGDRIATAKARANSNTMAQMCELHGSELRPTTVIDDDCPVTTSCARLQACDAYKIQKHGLTKFLQQCRGLFFTRNRHFVNVERDMRLEP